MINRQKVEQAVKETDTNKQAAEKLECTPQNLYAWLKRHNLKIQKKSRRELVER